MFGILNLNKPAGWTSRDAVNGVQRLVRPQKVGHAGTLDPLATGVLVACIGPATKLIEFVQQMPKVYSARFLLGQRSPSGDLETPAEALPSAPRPTRAQIEHVLPQFVGHIEQTPPVYSAAKVGGRRAYRLARQGADVKIAPRTVRVDALDVVAYDYPELCLTIRCGGGTYIRSLGCDIAAALKSAAVMSGLVRTRVGDYRIENAISALDLSTESIRDALLSPLTALGDLPAIKLDEREEIAVRNGRSIVVPQERRRPLHVVLSSAACSPNTLPLGASVQQASRPSSDVQIAAIDQAGRLIALLHENRPGKLAPARVFPQSS